MTYRPGRTSNKEIIISVAFAVVAVLMILLSGIINRFGGLYQISAIICGVVSIEMYMKYVGSDYVYEAADDAFKVYKITGKKSICVSCLDYDKSLSLVVSGDEFEKHKGNFPTYNFNVNLCKNLLPKNYCVYFFEFNGKKSMMKFEPDELFVDFINEKIQSAWQSTVADDDYDLTERKV